MNLDQAIMEATRTKRSRVYVFRGSPESIAFELDHLEAKWGDARIADLIAWNEKPDVHYANT